MTIYALLILSVARSLQKPSYFCSDGC